MKNKKMIMFVSYDFSKGNSGSKIRPRRMYQAFINQGYEVFLISGNKSEKIKGLNKLKESNEEFDFAYIEPSSYPLEPLIDYKTILMINKRTNHIGIFYRDAYWLFEEYFHIVGSKRMELILRYKIDLLFYKKISDVMFFPSKSMSELFNFPQPKIALPPGTHNNIKDINGDFKKSNKSAIYVGGISKELGLDILLESFREVNVNKIVLLTLVCRSDEMKGNEDILSKYVAYDWLTIKHIFGEELDNEYLLHDFAIIPRPKNEYNDFAMPIKFFEYLSNGLPVLSTNCFETEKVMIKYKLGIVKSSEIKDFCSGIEKMCELHLNYRENVINYINEVGSWDERARKVITFFNKVET